MFTFLSYGIGSILVGAAVAIIICALLLFLSVRQSRYGTLSPIALLSAIVLFLLLSYQLINLFGAIHCKAIALDAIDSLRNGLQNVDLQSGKQIVDALIDQYPIVNAFFDTSMLNDINWSDPLKSLHDMAASRFNGFIYARLGWAVGFTVVFGAAMFIPFQGGIGGGRRTRHDASDSDPYYGEDFY